MQMWISVLWQLCCYNNILNKLCAIAIHTDPVLIGLIQDQKLANRDLGSESQSRHISVLIYNGGEMKPVAQAGLEAQ